LPLVEGLYVMVFGMGLVFFSLIVIMFTMMALERVFRLKVPGEGDAAPVAVAPETPTAQVEPTANDPHLPGRPQGQVAAAIAVSMARARAGNARRSRLFPKAVASGQEAPADWMWDEGVEDYGVVEGSYYAKL
jgi:sodium pump decarboxylase gamma subunit